MILEKETALFQKDKIKDDINSLKEATGSTASYFWHVDGSEDESGAHVTEVPRTTFESNPQGANILMRSNSIKIRRAATILAEFDADGMRVYENGDVVARFEADGAVIGAVGEQRALVNQSGFSILDGQDTEQFSVKAQGKTVTDTKEADMAAQSNGIPSKRICAMASGTSITVTLTAYNSSHVQTYSQTWNTTATAQTFQVNRSNINLVCAGASNSGLEFRLRSTSQSDSYVRVKIEWVDTYLVPLISTIGDCDISGLTTASNVHNAITAEPANYVYLVSGGTYYSVPLQESIKIGNGDLEIDDDNTHVICYKSGTIMVSGQVQFYGVNDTNILNARITVGGTVIAQSSTRARGNRCSLFITPRLANVVIVSPVTAVTVTLQVVNSSESGGYVASSNSSTPEVADIDRAKNYLTVQYV